MNNKKLSNDWTITALGLERVNPAIRARLAELMPVVLPKGHVLFRPGDPVETFVMVLSGRVGVYLSGANGRELLLYTITPGETCVQTTLGLMGEMVYKGEAVAETDISAVLVPHTLFTELMGQSRSFRTFVFKALANRLQTVMSVLENVAFVTVEARLAQCLVDRAENGTVHATHQELATVIGSSREVVSRRLEALARQNIVALERGAVHILDADALTERLSS